jgi:hypothetical protein
MPAAPTPTPKDVERALNRLTADQFAQACSEIGILEVTLPGGTQAARAATLVQRTAGHPDFSALVRAINRIDPKVWSPIPARVAMSSLAYGVLAFAAIFGIGGLILIVILSGPDQAAQVAPTSTPTLAPTRTPVPTLTHTPSPTSIPSETPTPSRTPTSTRDPSAAPTRTLEPTATTTPRVSIVYPKIDLQKPASGSGAYPGDTVEFRWLLRSATIASDERYLMRLYFADSGGVADTYVTTDPWRFYQVPPGAIGVFNWTVTVVKVDAANNVIGPISPESDAWSITWQP